MNKEKIQDMVHEILIIHPETRNSDRELYYRVIEKVQPSVLRLPLGQTLLQYKELGIPNAETVGRCRRKLQADYPQLRADKATDEARFKEFKEFLDYALS